jgi:hypothetical protein
MKTWVIYEYVLIKPQIAVPFRVMFPDKARLGGQSMLLALNRYPFISAARLNAHVVEFAHSGRIQKFGLKWIKRASPRCWARAGPP